MVSAHYPAVDVIPLPIAELVPRGAKMEHDVIIADECARASKSAWMRASTRALYSRALTPRQRAHSVCSLSYAITFIRPMLTSNSVDFSVPKPSHKDSAFPSVHHPRNQACQTVEQATIAMRLQI